MSSLHAITIAKSLKTFKASTAFELKDLRESNGKCFWEETVHRTEKKEEKERQKKKKKKKHFLNWSACYRKPPGMGGERRGGW